MSKPADTDSRSPEKDAVKGVSAGWVVGLVITLTLGLGAAFLIVAYSHPVELVERDTAVRDASAIAPGQGDSTTESK